jgi:hypothetical protein
VSVDTGLNGCGVAAFYKDGSLRWAGYVRSGVSPQRPIGERVLAMAAEVEQALQKHCTYNGHLVVEIMQSYRGGAQGGDQNDLISLSLVGGAIAGLLRDPLPTFYKPRDWKGTMKANPCARRIIGRLNAEERENVENLAKFETMLTIAEARGEDVGGTDHNTIDAVGIGLKALGRFDARRAG